MHDPALDQGLAVACVSPTAHHDGNAALVRMANDLDDVLDRAKGSSTARGRRCAIPPPSLPAALIAASSCTIEPSKSWQSLQRFWLVHTLRGGGRQRNAERGNGRPGRGGALKEQSPRRVVGHARVLGANRRPTAE